jgi:hypothetical protein
MGQKIENYIVVALSTLIFTIAVILTSPRVVSIRGHGVKPFQPYSQRETELSCTRV